MKGHTGVRDQRQTPFPHDAARRAAFILLSAFAHLVALVAIEVFWRTPGVRILPEQLTTAQRISAPAGQSFQPSPRTRPYNPIRAHRSRRTARAPQLGTASGSASVEILREHAKQSTAVIMKSLRFRQVYGFTPTHDYRLAVQTAGQIPSVSADELPPRFEQYLVVEVTIDVDGRVAEARVVTGMADESIEQRLLSAIREFKYTPAKRDGVPVPSQLDIVIHIPT